MGVWVEHRKMVITLFQDVPGLVTTATNNTYPQFTIHVSIEGNNTLVGMHKRFHSVLQLLSDLHLWTFPEQRPSESLPLLLPCVLRGLGTLQAQGGCATRVFGDANHNQRRVASPSSHSFPGNDK